MQDPGLPVQAAETQERPTLTADTKPGVDGGERRLDEWDALLLSVYHAWTWIIEIRLAVPLDDAVLHPLLEKESSKGQRLRRQSNQPLHYYATSREPATVQC